jgi:ABC-type dipeptide/oligopeptide/nickel transport system ATPase component
MDKIRSKEIAIIFQEPMTSLNPVYTVGEQIAEVIACIRRLSRKQALGPRRRDAEAGQHSRTRSGACTTIRTSSPAACASG